MKNERNEKETYRDGGREYMKSMSSTFSSLFCHCLQSNLSKITMTDGKREQGWREAGWEPSLSFSLSFSF